MTRSISETPENRNPDMPVFELSDADILEGGRRGGQFLAQIGVTDMASLTREQWGCFCRLVVLRAFEASLARAVSRDEAPF